MSGKKQILDPLSCLCKIGMLAYYCKGTKISITKNIISFQEPDNIQWVKRKYFGDGKNDISTLYNPILKAIEWYILQNQNENSLIKEKDEEDDIEKEDDRKKERNNSISSEKSEKERGCNNEDDDEQKSINLSAVKNIIKHAIIGLTKLQYTYGDGNVTMAIKFLKNNLKMSLNDDFNMYKFMVFNEMDEPEENVINYSKIKEIWKADKIKLVSKQFDLLDKNKHDSSSLEYLLKSMKSQLMDTDSKFQELVKSMNSCL